MSDLTLLVLAAGLGSRYGGIKQMDPVGPGGEFVLDYSLYDAWKAGFNKAVLVVRDGMQEALDEHFGENIGRYLQIEYVVQDLANMPAGLKCPPTRTKPWGTGHAIWCARNNIQNPFASINADDFYGRNAYIQVAKALRQSANANTTTFSMVAYRLKNTLSDHGTVARGICAPTDDNYLKSVVERTNIAKTKTGATFQNQDGTWQNLTGDELVSMNFWGFNENLFPPLEKLLIDFLQKNAHEEKTEFYIPTVVDTLIGQQECRVQVLDTDERWFGMTYAEDRNIVVANVQELINQEKYPAKLWL